MTIRVPLETELKGITFTVTRLRWEAPAIKKVTVESAPKVHKGKLWKGVADWIESRVICHCESTGDKTAGFDSTPTLIAYGMDGIGKRAEVNATLAVFPDPIQEKSPIEDGQSW